MKYLLILCFVFGVIFMVTAFANENNTRLRPTVIRHTGTIDTSKYAILTYNKKRDQDVLDTNSKPTSLLIADIKTVDIILNKYIWRYNKQCRKFWRQDIAKHPNKYHNSGLFLRRNAIGNPSTYYKQLIPVINEKGEKTIYVNCFCSSQDIEDHPDWKKRLILVFDGGSCYFQLKINLTNKKAYDLTVNGNG